MKSHVCTATPAFLNQIASEFEPGYTVNYHLSPPILPLGQDARGRPNKRVFGAWMGAAFKLLSRCSGLRGSRFDPFSRQLDRALERELIVWYHDAMAEVAVNFSKLTEAQVEDILAAPMDIRGYGPVKDKAAHEVKARVQSLMGATVQTSN